MRQLRTWSLKSQRTGVQTPARTFSTPWSKASQSFNVLNGMELGTVSISWESYSEDQMHVKQHRACEHSLNVITISNRVSYYKTFTYQDSTQIHHHLWTLSWLAIPPSYSRSAKCLFPFLCLPRLICLSPCPGPKGGSGPSLKEESVNVGSFFWLSVTGGMLTSFSFMQCLGTKTLNVSQYTHLPPSAHSWLTPNALFRKVALGCSPYCAARQDSYTGRNMNEMREIKGPSRDGVNRQVKHSGSFWDFNWGIWGGLTNQ